MQPSDANLRRGTAPPGAVVVTGASTGIGRASVLRLADAGFRVFAGVRRESDGKDLAAAGPGGRITPLRLDVCDQEQIRSAATELAAALGPEGLAGLVNNAGIGVAGPVESLPLSELRRQFEVNVFGLVAVTQAFLPLIRAGRGRIVTIGSAGGWITMPFGGPLCASKHAVRSLNDALRLELRASGIPVVLIDPGSIDTPSVDKFEAETDAVVDRMGPDGRRLYADAFRAMAAKAVAHERAGSPPDVVAAAVHRALTAPRPATRRSVGAHAALLILLARTLPNPLLDRFRLRVLGLDRPGLWGRLPAAGRLRGPGT
ncbi:SDR family oxidoreductase [Streptomyces sp. NPDC020996]|uniref:SDR family oxidoreductase n=1 Tax=Streptomyces sp. NPDC020996 TaxID=3154791 RepID=UPI0033FF2C32